MDSSWVVVEQVWPLTRIDNVIHGYDTSWQIQTEDGSTLTTLYSREIAEHIVSLHNGVLAKGTDAEG